MNSDDLLIDAAVPEDIAAAARVASGGGDGVIVAGDLRGAARGWGVSRVLLGAVAVIEQRRDRPAELRVGESVLRTAPRYLDLLDEVLQNLAVDDLATGYPGELAGYIGFDLCDQIEQLPAPREDGVDIPLARLMLFDQVIELDPRRGMRLRSAAQLRRRLAAWLSKPIPAGFPAAEHAARWAAACVASPTRACAAPRISEPPGCDFVQAVAAALDFIAAGDIYQVNLARRLEVNGLPDPWSVAATALRQDPAFGALVCWREVDDVARAVISASPELFLDVRAGRVRTCPIKGTRPRGRDAQEDAARREALLRSAKDAAELAMIVDLHRNDLGRVCRWGSVRVAAPRRLESTATVHHTCADIEGQLAEGKSIIDLLRAALPPGSISGVPKVRALELIRTLEPVRRDAYTGCVGRIGLDGSATLNVAIRTLQQVGARGWLHVGGGIVAESRPLDELAETQAKAVGWLDGLRAASRRAD